MLGLQQKKLAHVAGSAQEQSLHPYFDNLGNDRWLVVEIQPSVPPTISFFIRPSIAWSAVLAARVAYHFALMGLGELYAAQAASELADISYALEELGSVAGAAGVRSHLDFQFRSRLTHNANSWKTALYEGLRDSTWFCAEGYRMVRAQPVPTAPFG